MSFISRQRDLSQLVGEDVTGADVKNLEAQVEYLAGRFDVVSLEDRNLPAIIKERMLKPKNAGGSKPPWTGRSPRSSRPTPRSKTYYWTPTAPPARLVRLP